MELKNSGLLIAIPAANPPYWSFMECMMAVNMPRPIYYKRVYGEAVDLARNHFVEYFLGLEEKPRFLLFIDSDATFHEDSFIRLMERDLPVVCGFMYTTKLPPLPTIGTYAGMSKDGRTYYKFADTVRKIVAYCKKYGYDERTLEKNANCFPMTEDDLIERDGCGMHFTMIRRDVFEAVQKPYFLMGGKTGSGEDFYFCNKAREAGFPIYADLSVHTGHLVGEDNDFGLRELLAWLKYVNQEWDIEDERRWEIDWQR